MKKIVLAYSGGLDTSVILPWLKERYPGVKLVAFAAELGQGDELKGIEDKAYKSGADEVVIQDLREEFATKYCFPMLRAHAIYEQDYLLGTSIARPPSMFETWWARVVMSPPITARTAPAAPVSTAMSKVRMMSSTGSRRENLT